MRRGLERIPCWRSTSGAAATWRPNQRSSGKNAVRRVVDATALRAKLGRVAMTLHVAIVGAGLGGLAAAVFLRKADIDVTVYEQGGELHEVGAGIVGPPSSMPGTGGSSLGP